jgi:hypothetical protein
VSEWWLKLKFYFWNSCMISGHCSPILPKQGPYKALKGILCSPWLLVHPNSTSSLSYPPCNVHYPWLSVHSNSTSSLSYPLYNVHYWCPKLLLCPQKSLSLHNRRRRTEQEAAIHNYNQQWRKRERWHRQRPNSIGKRVTEAEEGGSSMNCKNMGNLDWITLHGKGKVVPVLSWLSTNAMKTYGGVDV